MNCVILQPSYIPWRGYFDLIHRADVFVFYDDVQYDKHGWRNRNRIKTPEGTKWLTIPVRTKGVTGGIPILAIETNDDEWPRRHLDAITRSYASAPYFETYRPWLEKTFLSPPRNLAELTIATTIELASMLGTTHTRFLRSSSLEVPGHRSDRLIAILRRLGATHYLSGPSAKAYIEEEKFADAGIALEWMAYDYPEYPQLHGAFDPQVSVVDLLFMTGGDAPKYIWER